MDNDQRFIYLFERFAAKKYSLAEKEELFSMISSTDYDATLQQLVGDQWNLTIPAWVRENDDQKAADIFQQIMDRVKVKELLPDNVAAQTIGIAGRRRFWRNIAAAAAVLVLGAGAYFIYLNKTDKETTIAKTPAQQYKNDVAPGGNKAILTLADGSQIVLDSAADGALSQQGSTKIIKLYEGQLAYNGTDVKGAVMYNTVSTPKGGQYQIVLSDGSKVWLNATSSLRFPASFTGKDRNVELTGEGYFEIAKNTAMPFFVKVNDMQVEVLGTHFNVNAYDDEAAMKTTLLEGSVKVNTGSVTSLLRPGQQAQLNRSGEIKVVNADVDEAVAWKNGVFNFSNADLQAVLRQLARWYDVDVLYEGSIPKRAFKGEMQRDLNLSEVLKILEKNNVHFKIDGKKIVVTP